MRQDNDLNLFRIVQVQLALLHQLHCSDGRDELGAACNPHNSRVRGHWFIAAQSPFSRSILRKDSAILVDSDKGDAWDVSGWMGHGGVQNELDLVGQSHGGLQTTYLSNFSSAEYRVLGLENHSLV